MESFRVIIIRFLTTRQSVHQNSTYTTSIEVLQQNDNYVNV